MNLAMERAAMDCGTQLPVVRDDEVTTLRAGVTELTSVVQEAYDDLLLFTRRPSDADIIAWRERAAKALGKWGR